VSDLFFDTFVFVIINDILLGDGIKLDRMEQIYRFQSNLGLTL